MKYRPEIDGLRAVAVVPVILYHAGFQAFSGGFAGVDVFFVISGYLITTIIAQEIAQGSFSLLRFYERRARRILPALFVVVAFCALAGLALLAPGDLEAFGRSVVAVMFFASNFLFWSESGYFDTASELKPLLHTWSLAVEEQFYILFPFVLVLGKRLGARTTLALLVAIFAVSLILADIASERKPDAGFYLLPARAWELMIGAFCALALSGRRRVVPERWNGVLSALGFGMILAAVFFYDSGTPFPGRFALLPTAGTALIILFANPGTLTAWFLSLPAVVGVGLVSYSAYLWHHPLFAFTRYDLGYEPGAVVMLALSVMSLGLGWLSWRFIEAPFRDRTRTSARMIFGASLCGGIALSVAGLGLVATNGLPQRAPQSFQITIDTVEDRSDIRSHPKRTVYLGDASNVVGAVIGDSHADTLAETLDAALVEEGLGLALLTRQGCPPIRGILRHDIGVPLPSRCDDWNRDVYQRLIEDDSLHVVVIAARFTLYLESDRFDNGEGGAEHVETGRVIFDALDYPQTVRDDAERFAFLSRQFEVDFEALLNAGKHLVLVYPIPEVGWDVPRVAWKWRGQPEAENLHTSLSVFQARNVRAIEVLDRIGPDDRVSRIRPDKVFCDGIFPDRCAAIVEAEAYYWDTNHLNNTGAGLLAPDIVGAVRDAAR